MLKHKYNLTSINPDQNRNRFYSIVIQPRLFGDFDLIRFWGRIGAKSRKLVRSYQTIKEVEIEVNRLLRVRKRHGYVAKSKNHLLIQIYNPNQEELFDNLVL